MYILTDNMSRSHFCYYRFGTTVNADSVLRSVYYKYLHPKEVFIAEGVLVPDIARKKVTLFV